MKRTVSGRGAFIPSQLTYLFFALVLFVSCGPLVDMGGGETPGGIEPDVDYSDFFKEDELESGVYHFAVNGKAYTGGQGHTFWVMCEPGTESFTEVSVDLVKYSGHRHGGYGVLFCETDSPEGKVYLTVLLTIQGEFCVGKIVHNQFEYLHPWEESVFLREGYERKNTLTVKRKTADSYEVELNGEFVFGFVDEGSEASPVASGGGFGLVAVVSPLESFPDLPVKIDFDLN